MTVLVLYVYSLYVFVALPLPLPLISRVCSDPPVRALTLVLETPANTMEPAFQPMTRVSAASAHLATMAQGVNTSTHVFPIRATMEGYVPTLGRITSSATVQKGTKERSVELASIIA